ncbi:MAG: initiation factor 2B [Thermoprotei archaeon]|nr:initiation factor 2B [Thermoprotei archaeon]
MAPEGFSLSRLKTDLSQGSTVAISSALNFLADMISEARDMPSLINSLAENSLMLLSARPASGLLFNALRSLLLKTLELMRSNSPYEDLKKSLLEEIRNLVKLYKDALRSIGVIGAKRLEDGDVVLTGTYSSTVFSILRQVAKEGKRLTVYVTESRPGSEGFKLAKDLSKMGFNVVLFVDSAVRYFMKDVDKVLLGAEAIAANGAVVSKIGTSLIALAAHEARVRVFVATSIYKSNPRTMLGELITLEEVPESQILSDRELKELGVRARCPLFEVIPPEYIDALITERGLLAPQAVPLLMRNLYGWPPEAIDLEELIDKLRGSVKR